MSTFAKSPLVLFRFALAVLLIGANLSAPVALAQEPVGPDGLPGDFSPEMLDGTTEGTAEDHVPLEVEIAALEGVPHPEEEGLLDGAPPSAEELALDEIAPHGEPETDAAATASAFDEQAIASIEDAESNALTPAPMCEGDPADCIAAASVDALLLSGVGSQLFDQDTAGVPDTTEPGDDFGYALASGDFNGDGRDDLAVGLPFEDVNGDSNAGAVAVLYASTTRLTGIGSQIFTQDSAGISGVTEASDIFGFAIKSGDFDDDGYADLAIGVPGEAIGAVATAGVVQVLYGSATGLISTGNQLFDQNSPGVSDVVESGDRFGYTLASGQFDDDRYDDLAIGVPYENIGATADGGAINVLRGSASGLTGNGGRYFTQDSPSIPGGVEVLDLFGLRLAAGDFDSDGRDDLAVGIPYEDIGAVANSGGACVIYGAAAGLTGVGSQLFTEDTTGVSGIVEASDLFASAVAAGDINGDGRDDLVVGIPYEDIGATGNAGTVLVLNGAASGVTAAGSDLVSQDTAGVPGVVEASDLFGYSLAVGDFDNDGRDDLSVGVPFEDQGALTNAGAVNVLYGAASGPTGSGSQIFSEDTANVPGIIEASDFFGFALATGNYNGDRHADLAIGVPFEDLSGEANVGTVVVLYEEDDFTGLLPAVLRVGP